MNESKTRRLEDDIPRFVFHDINDQKQGAAVATIGDDDKSLPGVSHQLNFIEDYRKLAAELKERKRPLKS
jgi:hypothetical protein